uniref:TLC domain-containing protein n=1 Tax=Chenopodium quinoa TaxID=63459 RepID=A0A803M642_CHEQI
MEPFLKSSGIPEAWHIIVAIYFAVFFVGARFFFDKFIFRDRDSELANYALRNLFYSEVAAVSITGISLKLFYMCQCGFYIYSIAALLTWETRRKDFAVMMSHHIITVLLISCSYMTSFFRIGSIVLALHDASDVFMEAAKISKYSDKELAASVFFGLFALSWLMLRLIFFPFWAIRATSIDLCTVLNLSDPYDKVRCNIIFFLTADSEDDE